jgi:hypothetical protein
MEELVNLLSVLYLLLDIKVFTMGELFGDQ